MDDDIVVGDITVPRQELVFRFDASGGPGGQNVNKVATKATLKWNVMNSRAWIGHEDARARFLEMFANRINKLGELVIQSQRERHQRQNAYQCIVKLGEMIAQAAIPPAIRIQTSPSLGGQQRRMREKEKLGRRKEDRRRNRGGWSEF
jgi:ribosome-associated protein